MPTSDDLQRAYQLIKAGNKDEATKLLIPIVRADNNNADAWWLLANAVPRADQSRSALKQVLRLRPDDKNAQRMMDQLLRADSRTDASTASTPKPKPTGTLTPPAATFDEDAFGASAPSVYEDDDPFADEPSTTPKPDDVWDDPFAPVAEDIDPFTNITTTLENAQRGGASAASSQPELTDDDDLFMPPERRRSRSALSDRPASIDDDLFFDDDPFDPVKPEPPSRPTRTASRPASTQKAKRSSSSAAKSGAKSYSGGGKSRSSGGKRKTDDILIRDDFEGDPFAPNADLRATQSGFDRLLTIGLAIVLLGAAGLLVLLLVNNSQNQAPSQGSDTQTLIALTAEPESTAAVDADSQPDTQTTQEAALDVSIDDPAGFPSDSETLPGDADDQGS